MWYLRGVYLIINTKILAKKDNRLGAIGDIIFTIKKEKNALTLIAINVPDVEQRRKLAIAEIAEDGQVLDMVEKPDAPGNFPSWLFKITSVYAYKGEGECSDIGTPENYREVSNEYKDR